MPDEINPMAEMGLVHDKQAIIEPQGFLTNCDAVKALCERFIPKGGKFYDLVRRYENVTSYILNRDEKGSGTDASKMVAPFLKAFGATDYDVMRFYEENLQLADGAKEVMRYLVDVMPVFMDSCMYCHATDVLCDKLGMPRGMAGATALDLSDNACNISRQESWELRSIAKEIVELRLPKEKYELNVPLEMGESEIAMVSALDDIFLNRLNGTAASEMISNTVAVGANEKAYALLDIRKSTQVDLDGTIYVGGDMIDYQVMDLVKDGNGLSLSFNGSEFAVHGSNVAVISKDCTVGAVLSAEFYDSGIQGVFDLVDNWDRDYLKKADFPDRNLLNTMLAHNPRKLPEVYRVTRQNVGEIAARSDEFRKKWICSKPVTGKSR